MKISRTIHNSIHNLSPRSLSREIGRSVAGTLLAVGTFVAPTSPSVPAHTETMGTCKTQVPLSPRISSDSNGNPTGTAYTEKLTTFNACKTTFGPQQATELCRLGQKNNAIPNGAVAITSWENKDDGQKVNDIYKQQCSNVVNKTK